MSARSPFSVESLLDGGESRKSHYPVSFIRFLNRLESSGQILHNRKDIFSVRPLVIFFSKIKKI